MKSKKIMVLLVLLCAFVISACAAQNQYSVNLTIEQEITALADQYALWYELAPPEVQKQWKKVFDPAFYEIDLLLDTYHELLLHDMSTEAVIMQINQLKTRIMMALIKNRAAKKQEPEDDKE